MKTLLIAGLCLIALPALAAQPTAPQAVTADAPIAAAQSAGACQASAPLGSFPVAELSICIADCSDGSTVTCSGSSCSAVDAACPYGEQGHCWSNTEGTKYCPACPPLPCSPLCSDVEGSFCVKDWTTTCYDPALGCRRPLTCACHNGAYICP